MSYVQYDREINGLRYTAKRRLNLRNDEELAKLCGCSALGFLDSGADGESRRKNNNFCR